MTASPGTAGYFRTGLPYNRFGHGPRTAVIFQGLLPENKPLGGLLALAMTRMYRFLDAEYTSYLVTRRPGLPAGYSMRDMADDYARTIQQTFGAPVDVIGSSTGGSIAQHFAADHPRLLRRLVLHSSAHTLGDAGKRCQLDMAELARRRNWRAASAVMLSFVLPPGQWFTRPAVRLGSLLMALSMPANPSDWIVTIEAEDKHEFKTRLAEIKAPTLVIAGDRDPFYSPRLFRETAQGIPNARLVLYPAAGHAPSGRRFERDVLDFLLAEDVTAVPSAQTPAARSSPPSRLRRWGHGPACRLPPSQDSSEWPRTPRRDEFDRRAAQKFTDPAALAALLARALRVLPARDATSRPGGYDATETPRSVPVCRGCVLTNSGLRATEPDGT